MGSVQLRKMAVLGSFWSPWPLLLDQGAVGGEPPTLHLLCSPFAQASLQPPPQRRVPASLGSAQVPPPPFAPLSLCGGPYLFLPPPPTPEVHPALSCPASG